MRILFATNHSYLPQRAGGSESSTHDLCMQLLQNSVSVAVLAGLEPGGFIGLSNRVRRKANSRNLFPMDHVMGYPVFRGWFPIEGVEEVVRRFDPDLAIMQAGRPMALANEFLRLAIPGLVYLRDTVFDQLGGPVSNTDPKVCFVANSEYTATAFKNAFGINPTVIPPLVEPRRYRVESKRQTLLFVNPVEVKGVEIAFRLAEARSDIPFVFVESWGLSKQKWRELETHARKLGNIRLYRRTMDMRRFYQTAKVILVPSRLNEAWCRVVTEAQLSGIPILASDLGGLSESVGPGGILVDPDDDFTVWMEALSRLWDSQEEYENMSDAALDHSRRAKIRPDFLISKLLAVISDHIEMPASLEP